MKSRHYLLLSLLVIPAALSVFSNKIEFKATNAAQKKDNFAAYTYSGNYYSSISSNLTTGLNGTLRQALTTLVHPSGWYSYSGTSSSDLGGILQHADADPTNSSNMIYFYTRNSDTKVKAGSTWNREHCWPQANSNGNWGTGGAGADLLHIRPTYYATNSARGNYKYGDASGSYLVHSGTGLEYAKKGNYFEPLPANKGDCARIIMYVWTAYKNQYSTLPEITSIFSSYDTMMLWHINDAPDALEGSRNNYSQNSKQKNRNPFVDHPEYAWQIFGEKCSADVLAQAKAKYPGGGVVTDTKVNSIKLNYTSFALNAPDATYSYYYVDLVATVGPQNATNKTVSWSSSDSSIATVTSTGQVRSVKEGRCTITCSATDGSGVKATCEITVGNVPKSGCGGSIVVTSSLLFVCASIGLGLVINKKKHEDK